MAFTVSDFEDLLKLLSEHPDWQARLRPVILGEEILQIPSRMDRVEAVLERVAQRADSIDQQLAQLTVAVQENARQISELTKRMDKVDGRLSNIEGGWLENRYERHTGGWFGKWLARARLLDDTDWDQIHSALADNRLSTDDVAAIQLLDLVVTGRDRSSQAGEPLYFAVEISQTVNVDDVDRAIVRGRALARAGFRVRPFVGGYRITDEARKRAEDADVIVDLHSTLA